MFDDTRTVERPQFFDGQQLFAADLDGIVAFHRAMRWLHNRSLHQPGVGNGFAVSGRRGDREVPVQPGYALDSEGRELVLLETHVEPVPPVAGEPGGGPAFFDLVVSYPSDDDLEEAETREGVCLPRGVVRLREHPVFCWVRLIRDVNDRLRPLSEAQALEIQNGLADRPGACGGARLPAERRPLDRGTAQCASSPAAADGLRNGDGGVGVVGAHGRRDSGSKADAGSRTG